MNNIPRPKGRGLSWAGLLHDGSFAIQWIPAGIAGTRVGEVVDLRSATQRRFVVEVTVSDVTTTTSNTVAGGSGKRQGMNKIKHI